MRERGLGFRGGMSEDLCGHGKKARWRKDVWRGVSAFMCAFLLFVVSVVPVASHEKLASEDYTLQIYGNANEDDTVDMRDVTYIKLVIFGKKPETELCDANYDGRISMLDVVQTKLIIVGKEGELTIVDSANRTVTVKKPVKKIVTLTVASTESIKILKAQDKVVGVVKYVKDNKKFFPELSKLPSVGTWYEGVDYEKIFELDPDIVITYTGYTPELEDKLKPAGIAVVRLDLYKPIKVIEEIEELGYILDKKEEAKKFIDFYEGVMETIKERVEGISEKDKPRVYHEFYTDYAGWSSGGWDMMITIAGGINIIAELPGGYGGYVEKIDKEWVVEQNPDIIIRDVYYPIPGGGYEVDDPSGLKAEREAIMNRPELAGVTAVKEGRVYAIAWDFCDTIKHFIGIAYMAKWFHPELFEDLDPKSIHQEYLTRFQGLDYDLDEHGVFVYHPEEHPDGK